MSKRMRRTVIVTFTITEIWTITWASEDDPLRRPPTVGEAQANTEEQPDEAMQTTLVITEPAPTSHTPAAVDLQPGAPTGLPADNLASRRRGKRPRIRRAKEDRSRK